VDSEIDDRCRIAVWFLGEACDRMSLFAVS
jgi:hypothetical protein